MKKITFLITLNIFYFAFVSSKVFSKPTEEIHRIGFYRLLSSNKTLHVQSTGKLIGNLSELCPKNSEIKLIVHGFAETWNMTFRWDWVRYMADEMLRMNKTTDTILCVLALDWKELARGGVVANYFKAIENLHITADLVAKTFNHSKINPMHIHCIGFSLGAHTCSMIGKYYYAQNKVKIARITGLDPAGPFYKEKNDNEKLSKGDASFVDVIHTSNDFGVDEKAGHMDFYPINGFSEVKGCNNLNDRYDTYEKVILYQETNGKETTSYHDIEINDKELNKTGGLRNWSLSKIKSLRNGLKSFWAFLSGAPKRVFTKLHQFFGCNHLMAVRFFIYSINDCNFYVSSCGLKQAKCELFNKSQIKPGHPRMGYHADKSPNAFKYSNSKFVYTSTEKVPFCTDPV